MICYAAIEMNIGEFGPTYGGRRGNCAWDMRWQCALDKLYGEEKGEVPILSSDLKSPNSESKTHLCDDDSYPGQEVWGGGREWTIVVMVKSDFSFVHI